MEVIVSLDHRFKVADDGSAWSDTMFTHAFWERYLSVFDSVKILARGLPCQEIEDGHTQSTGPGVTFVPVPYFKGPAEFLRRRRATVEAISRAYNPHAAYVLRVASCISNLLESTLAKKNHIYGVEVVGDPWDTFSPGASRHLLRPLFRWKYYTDLRRQCRNASVASYVTERALQKRYPSPNAQLSTNYSSVELNDEAFSSSHKLPSATPRRIVSVGTLETLYKGPDLLLHAAQICIHNYKLDLEFDWIGGGHEIQKMQVLRDSLGLSGCFQFLGKLPKGAAIRDKLDTADLFVLPSRQEGLPRALIEAMARGLPCVATAVGGNSELLSENAIVEPNSPEKLAEKIRTAIENRRFLEDEAARNLTHARDYHDDLTNRRRVSFLQKLLNITQESSPFAT